MERTGTGDRPYRERDRCRLKRRPAPDTAVQQSGGDGNGKHAGCRVPGAAPPGIGVVAGLERGRGPAERGHRVTAAGIAGQRVQRHPGGEPGRERPSRAHQAIVPEAAMVHATAGRRTIG